MNTIKKIEEYNRPLHLIATEKRAGLIKKDISLIPIDKKTLIINENKKIAVFSECNFPKWNSTINFFTTQKFFGKQILSYTVVDSGYVGIIYDKNVNESGYTSRININGYTVFTTVRPNTSGVFANPIFPVKKGDVITILNDMTNESTYFSHITGTLFFLNNK